MPPDQTLSAMPTRDIVIRPATAADAADMAGILNRIIDAGGTTAHQTSFTANRMLRHYVAPPRGIACMVAVLDGKLMGFQSLVWPDDEGMPFPDNWAIIASFVDAAGAGNGLGSKLFAQTAKVGRAAGVVTIDATIRADNTGGLAYYSRLGFVDYDVISAVPLRDGSVVDRVRKRIDLVDMPASFRY